MSGFATILDGYLEEFEQGTAHIRTDGIDGSELVESARVLCSLSRDIIFTLPLLSEERDLFVKRSVTAFQEAVSEIELHLELDQKMKGCLNGIRSRAQELLKPSKPLEPAKAG
jgi:hypothetical protein